MSSFGSAVGFEGYLSLFGNVASTQWSHCPSCSALRWWLPIHFYIGQGRIPFSFRTACRRSLGIDGCSHRLFVHGGYQQPHWYDAVLLKAGGLGFGQHHHFQCWPWGCKTHCRVVLKGLGHSYSFTVKIDHAVGQVVEEANASLPFNGSTRTPLRMRSPEEFPFDQLKLHS